MSQAFRSLVALSEGNSLLGISLKNGDDNSLYRSLSPSLLKSSFSDLYFFSLAIKNMRDSTGDTRNAGVRCLRISPDGQALATGDRSGNIRFGFLKKS